MALQHNGIDAGLIIQRVDLLYFTGTAQNGILYIPSQGDPLLFVKRYFPRARKESPLDQVRAIQSIREIPNLLTQYHSQQPKILGLEFDVMPVAEYHFFQKLFPSQKLVDLSSIILDIRKLKSTWDIKQMEQTAEMSALTFDYMRQVLAPGMTEMEFASTFEAFARQAGHAGQVRVRHYQTEGYPWHVLSGSSGGMIGVLDSPASGAGSSYAFPCGASTRKIRSQEPVMVDFASVQNGYHMDETRMFVIGKMPPDADAASQAAIAIQQELLASIQPGMRAHDIYHRSVKTAKALGFKDSYLGIPGHQVSFIGHGIGYELIEPPFIAHGKEDVLLSGMTIAFEPKFVFADKFSAGIESVFHITDSGARLISKTPVEIFML
jgi:Xaa-Pro aminopeptidase